MNNINRFVFLALGGLGLCTFSLADPSPVSSQFMTYELSPTLVSNVTNYRSNGVTGTFQFGPLNLPANYSNFQVFTGGPATESFNPISQTLTATYGSNTLGEPVAFSYDSAATTAPGNVLTPGKDANGNFVEFKPIDPVFTPQGTKYMAK